MFQSKSKIPRNNSRPHYFAHYLEDVVLVSCPLVRFSEVQQQQKRGMSTFQHAKQYILVVLDKVLVTTRALTIWSASSLSSCTSSWSVYNNLIIMSISSVAKKNSATSQPQTRKYATLMSAPLFASRFFFLFPLALHSPVLCSKMRASLLLLLLPICYWQFPRLRATDFDRSQQRNYNLLLMLSLDDDVLAGTTIEAADCCWRSWVRRCLLNGTPLATEAAIARDSNGHRAAGGGGSR